MDFPKMLVESFLGAMMQSTEVKTATSSRVVFCSPSPLSSRSTTLSLHISLLHKNETVRCTIV